MLNVCRLFVCLFITYNPLERFASNFSNRYFVVSLIILVKLDCKVVRVIINYFRVFLIMTVSIIIDVLLFDVLNFEILIIDILLIAILIIDILVIDVLVIDVVYPLHHKYKSIYGKLVVLCQTFVFIAYATNYNIKFVCLPFICMSIHNL